MQILLACAKLMNESPESIGDLTGHVPMFQTNADRIAAEMCRYSINELSEILNVNKDIATSTHRRFNDFFDKSTRSFAITRYDGIVFKKIDAATLSPEDLDFADAHINICSFVYGLLRPLDEINPYRMEGNVELPALGGISMFDYWKPILTDILIKRVNEDDGILLNLASDEMRKLFDWKRVSKEVKIITPSFKVEKDGKLSNITIYAKMCRGAMTRYVIKNRISDVNEIRLFDYEGFAYSQSPTEKPQFILR